MKARQLPRPARHHDGFMFLELLIVLGVLGVLSAITVVAINPVKHFCETANARRHLLTRELNNALKQYEVETFQKAGEGIPTTEGSAKPVCRPGITDASCVNLDLLVPEFLVSLPLDPAETDERYTGYSIYRLNNLDMIKAARLQDCDDL